MVSVAHRSYLKMQNKEEDDKVARLELLHKRMIEEISDYAVILLDLDGTILSWNKGAEAIKGYKEAEIIGQNFALFYPHEARLENIPEQMLEQARTEGTAKYIGRRLRKDGTLFWGSMLLTAIHDEQGNVIGYTKLTREIKE